MKKTFTRFGLDWVLASEPARRVRKLLFQMRLDDVVELADALKGGGVEWWLTGGWGIDSLLGTQTRAHDDADLCIDAASNGERRAIEILEGLGYELIQDRARGGRYMPVRCVLRNRAGRAIDLLIVQRREEKIPPDQLTGWPIPVLQSSDTTEGVIDGHSFPALSVAAQMAARSVYEPLRRDYRDMARLCKAYDVSPPSVYRTRSQRVLGSLRHLVGRFDTASGILVAVPAAQPLLNEFGAVDGSGLPPHITILHPFKKPRSIGDSDLAMLSRLAQSVGGPIDYELAQLGDFDGLTFVAPQPDVPFIELTLAAERFWPDHPPYGGEFEDIIPHLTLGVRDPSPVERDRISAMLPIRARATGLVLMTRNRRGRWRIHSSYPLRARQGSGR